MKAVLSPDGHPRPPIAIECAITAGLILIFGLLISILVA